MIPTNTCTNPVGHCSRQHRAVAQAPVAVRQHNVKNLILNSTKPHPHIHRRDPRPFLNPSTSAHPYQQQPLHLPATIPSQHHPQPLPHTPIITPPTKKNRNGLSHTNPPFSHPPQHTHPVSNLPSHPHSHSRSFPRTTRHAQTSRQPHDPHRKATCPRRA